MEKFNSAIQLVFAAFIVLFGFGTMIRCIIAGTAGRGSMDAGDIEQNIDDDSVAG